MFAFFCNIASVIRLFYVLRIALCWLSFLVLPYIGWGQSGNHHFNKLDVRDGLSHNQINAILKDEKGFLWFGSMSGLNRYDGYNFKVFRHTSDTNSISDNYITQIHQGPDNQLWVGTRSGWNKYDPKTESFNRQPLSYLQSLGLPDLSFTGIKKDKDNNYWFVYPGKGLYRYNSKRKKTDVYSTKGNEFHGNNISSLVQNIQGDLWVVYTDGVLERLDGKNLRVRQRLLLSPTKKELFNYNIFIDTQNDLWIYVPNNAEGVHYYNAATNALQAYRKEAGDIRLNNNVINGIAQDDKGLIWLATDHGGINIINKQTSSVQYVMNNPDDEKSISQNSVYSIYKDNTGIIWAGTYKKGINYFHDDFVQFPLFKHRPSIKISLPYDDVNCFVEDAKGNIWIGTNGGGIIYFDRSTGSFTQYVHQANNSNSVSNDVIVSLFIDKQQKLWIGTYFGGLDCYDGRQFIHYRHNDKNPNSLADDRVWEIYEDSQNRLWIGTLASGLDLFDRDKGVFHHYKPSVPNSVHSSYISSIHEDRAGNLWLGTAYGVDLLRKGAVAFENILNDPENQNSLSNNNVISVLEDSKGNIWVGTRDGLNLLNEDKKSFNVFTAENGLPDNTILSILEDNHGGIWISTPNGLSSINWKKDKNGELAIQTRNFDEKDGLQGKEFNESAALKTRKGELLFGGPYGFNLFYPDPVGKQQKSAPIVLTGLQVFNKPMNIGEALNGKVILQESIAQSNNLSFRYNQNIFSIEFAALDFIDAEKIKYVYTLEGFNKEWLTTDAGNRKATYTNLDPGKYTFRVRLVNADGSWSENQATLIINILPPFWLTAWAYLLYALIIAGILSLARYMTLRKAKMRFAIEQERREAHRLHELDLLKIKFFTNISHEFRTPLSLILAPLDKIIKNTSDNDQKKQLGLVQRNAKRLLNLVNLLLDFRKMEVQEFKLSATEGDLVHFVKDLTYSFSDIAEKKHIRLGFQSSQSSFITEFDKDKMEKIVFNLLSNAFRFTQDGGQIDVTTEMKPIENETFFTLQVKDTGIGIPKEDQEKIFERFFQHDTAGTVMNQGSGIGLAITKEFVRLFNGTITVESEPDKGSCFTMTMPVKNLETEKAVELPVEQVIVANGANGAAIEEDKKVSKKPTVLLVEDNEDFRFYLKDNLKSYYQVVEAVDGKEGWKKVTELQPDLIVSDIMMPNMNGLELSKKIKTDPRTSHIPTVLLTAMASEEQQLAGFQTGANDYITKPFNFEILLSRIKSLLHQRRQMQKAFQKQLEVNPAEITVTPLDEQFIKDALAIVEKNISNAEFSVEDFSRAMHMSRVGLYKKLVSITGRPPLEFIRSIRMKRAAQLLSKTQMSVSEVAYEVGFNNPKYFTRYFKEEFNVLPSQFANTKIDKPSK